MEFTLAIIATGIILCLLIADENIVEAVGRYWLKIGLRIIFLTIRFNSTF